MNQSKNYSHKQGLPPGSLIHTGEVYESKVSIEYICFDENDFSITENNDIREIFKLLQPQKVNWIKITGLHDVNIFEQIGKHFNIHPLMLEDILNTHHLPKFEDYGEQLFFTLKDLSIKDEDVYIAKKQLSFILGNHYLISFEEQKSDLFIPIVDRIKTHKGKLRSMQNDYLLYALTDIITDNYLKIIDNMDDDMEAIEEELLNNRSKLVLNKILSKRKQHLSLKKSVIPILEETKKLHHSESHLINEKTYIYFQDVIDHLTQVTQNLDTFREMISNLSELYLANNDIQMNDVMKRLTVVSTIFIPLTFIVGLYGMNFKYFPELQWEYGYLYIWLFMVGLTIGMIIYLKKREWF
ncbi:MAG: magnesium/cobalt transporter CorA [Bacteroidetes bacterium]|nr:magnesium/cobalt transporter CorA [Bacteroidota bacterium]